MPVHPSMTEHRLLVAGGRDFTDRARLEEEVTALANRLGDTIGVSIISGMARGADRLAYEMAQRLRIQCYLFPADWDAHGRRAGYLRNAQMVESCHSALLFWDGRSRGTAHTLRLLETAGKPFILLDY